MSAAGGETRSGPGGNATRWHEGPERAWIVTTSKCNLNCLHCARSIAEYREVAEATPDMEERVFRLFEEQVAPTLTTIQFGGTNLGEPMMSRQFESHVDRLKASPRLREVKLQTNGTYLLDQARLSRLVQQGVRIMVSLEGVTPASYQEVRGVKFAHLVKALTSLKALRATHPGSGSDLLLAFTVRRDTLGELVPLIEFARDMGASQVTVSHFVPIREEHRDQSLVYHQQEANRAFEGARRRAAELGVHFVCPEPFRDVDRGEAGAEEPPCFHPWTSVSVSENGDVMPCCATNAVMGNLREQDFRSIWHGKRFQTLREAVNSANPPSYCRGCVLRGVNLSKASGRLHTDPEYLLRSIGEESGRVEGTRLTRVGRRLARRARRTILRGAIARRLALGLRRLYWQYR